MANYRGKYPTKIKSVTGTINTPGKVSVTLNNGEKYLVGTKDTGGIIPKPGMMYGEWGNYYRKNPTYSSSREIKQYVVLQRFAHTDSRIVGFATKKEAVDFAKKMKATGKVFIVRPATSNDYLDVVYSTDKVAVKKNPVQTKLQSRPKPAGRLNKRIFTVEMKYGEEWQTEGIFPTEKSAREYARALDAKHGHAKYIRVTV